MVYLLKPYSKIFVNNRESRKKLDKGLMYSRSMY